MHFRLIASTSDRFGSCVLTGRNADRVRSRPGRASASNLGIETRRIRAETADDLSTAAHGKPELECLTASGSRSTRCRSGGNLDLYVVAADGSPRHSTADFQHIQQHSAELVSRWPSIYFGSNRTGDWQIWKTMPLVGGGEQVQITRGVAITPSSRRTAGRSFTRRRLRKGISEVPCRRRSGRASPDQGRAMWFDVADTESSI